MVITSSVPSGNNIILISTHRRNYLQNHSGLKPKQKGDRELLKSNINPINQINVK